MAMLFATAPHVGAQTNWTAAGEGRLGGSPSTIDLSGASFGDDATLWSVDNKMNLMLRWTESGSDWTLDGTWNIKGLASTTIEDPEGITWIAPGRVGVVDEATNRLLLISVSGPSASLDQAVDLTPWVGAPAGGDGLEGIAHSPDESDAFDDVFYVGLENSAELFRVVLPIGASTPSSVTAQTLAIPEIAGLAVDGAGEIYIVSEEDNIVYAMSSWDAAPVEQFSVAAMTQPEGIDIDPTGERLIVIGEGAQEYTVWTRPVSPPPTPTPPPPHPAPEVPSDTTAPPGASHAIARPTQSSDDAEQRGSSQMYLDSSDLELIEDRGDAQLVGIRFPGVDVPADAEILASWIEFETDEPSTSAGSVRIRGESNVDPATFSALNGDLSNRTTTAAAVHWSPSPWPVVNESHTTPDVAGIVSEIIAQPGWAAGQPMAFVFDGTGQRVAESFDGEPSAAAKLHVIWESDTPPTSVVASITSGADDVEQRWDGTINFGSGDLDFTRANRPVGLRYNVCIPAGATITNATVTLVADEADTKATSATIWTEVTGDAAAFTAQDLQSRTRSTASIDWPSWSTWSPGTVEVSPDISSLVAAVTSSSSWTGCGHIVVIIEGVGDREAISFETDPARAPLLTVDFIS